MKIPELFLGKDMRRKTTQLHVNHQAIYILVYSPATDHPKNMISIKSHIRSNIDMSN